MIVIHRYLYKQQHGYYSIVNNQCIMYANPSNDCFFLDHNHGIYLNETYLNASIKTVIYVFYTLMMSSEDALQMRWYLIGLKIARMLIEKQCISFRNGLDVINSSHSLLVVGNVFASDITKPFITLLFGLTRYNIGVSVLQLGSSKSELELRPDPTRPRP